MAHLAPVAFGVLAHRGILARHRSGIQPAVVKAQVPGEKRRVAWPAGRAFESLVAERATQRFRPGR
jgi:hypothetical protein